MSRLVFPACHDEDRYARRRLARLVDAGLLLRLTPLPVSRLNPVPYLVAEDSCTRHARSISARSLNMGDTP